MAGDAVLAPMAVPQVEFPAAGADRRTWVWAGLIGTWPGDVTTLAHTGGTIGQLAFLVAVPAHDLVVCLLTNSASGAALWNDLGRHVFDAVAGLELPPPLPTPESPADSRPDAAMPVSYERYNVSTEITPADDGTLSAAVSMTGLAAAARRRVGDLPARSQPAMTAS